MPTVSSHSFCLLTNPGASLCDLVWCAVPPSRELWIKSLPSWQSCPHLHLFTWLKQILCIFFNNSEYGLFWYKLHGYLKRIYILLSEMSIRSHWLMVADFVYSIADFLSSCSVHCWVRGVKVSSYNCEYAYFSFQFYLCITYFSVLFFSAYTFWIAMSSFYHNDMMPFCLVILFAPKNTLSDINIAITAFLLLMFACIFHPFTYNLCNYIWNEFLVDSICGSCFIIHSVNQFFGWCIWTLYIP